MLVQTAYCCGTEHTTEKAAYTNDEQACAVLRSVHWMEALTRKTSKVACIVMDVFKCKALFKLQSILPIQNNEKRDNNESLSSWSKDIVQRSFSKELATSIPSTAGTDIKYHWDRVQVCCVQ